MRRRHAALLLVWAALVSCLPAPTRCCPPTCRCDGGFVYCNERNLMAVPAADIPPDATVLYLQNNRIGSAGVPSGARALLGVRVVYLFGNRLDEFPRHLPSSVRELHLQENGIRMVSRQALASVPALEKLHLDDNAIATAGIEAGAFRHLGALKLLFFSRNHLSSVPDELPGGLEELRLEDNRIAAVSARAFHSLTKLKFLNLDGNLIADEGVESGALRGLEELTELSLSKNSLRAPPPHLPGVSLRKLLLHDNQIEHVPITTLAPLSKLTHLDLSNNQLSSLSPGTFDSLDVIHHLNLKNNPWQCDCRLAWLRAWLVKNNVVVRGTMCASPVSVRGKVIKELDPGDFVCSRQTPNASADMDPSNTSTKRWYLSTVRPDKSPPTEFPSKRVTPRMVAFTTAMLDEQRDLNIALKATSLSKDIIEVKWHDTVSVSAYKLSWELEGHGPSAMGVTKTVILSGDVRLHLLTDLVPLASYRICLEPIDIGNGAQAFADSGYDEPVCTVAAAGGSSSESHNAKVTFGNGASGHNAGEEVAFPTAALVGSSIALLVAAVLLGSFCWYSHKTGKYLVSRWAFIRSRQKEGDYVESGTKKDNSILEMSESSSYPLGAAGEPMCAEPYGAHPGYADWTGNLYKLQPGHGPHSVRYIEDRLLETHFIPV